MQRLATSCGVAVVRKDWAARIWLAARRTGRILMVATRARHAGMHAVVRGEVSYRTRRACRVLLSCCTRPHAVASRDTRRAHTLRAARLGTICATLARQALTLARHGLKAAGHTWCACGGGRGRCGARYAIRARCTYRSTDACDLSGAVRKLTCRTVQAASADRIAAKRGCLLQKGARLASRAVRQAPPTSRVLQEGAARARGATRRREQHQSRR